MKTTILTIIAMMLITVSFAQTPHAFNYQAVARNSSGAVLPNQAVSLRISIQQGLALTDVYVETHSETTNDFGLFGLEIGNGTVESGVFSSIDWSLGDYHIRIEMDEAGGSNYEWLGTSPLLYVPYAKYAESAGNAFSGNYNDLTNTPAFSAVALSGSYNDLTDQPVLAGDVTGTTGSTKVEKIQGLTVSNSIPANGQILKWNTVNQAWEPSEDELGAAGSTDGVVSGGSVSGTTSKTITLQRTNGLGDITFSFTDETNDADADPLNEIQNLNLSGNSLSISGGNSVNLSGLNTDNQALSLSGNTLSLTNGGSVTLPAETDGSITNEIQDMSLSGTTLSLSSDATTVSLASFMDNTDAQTLTFAGSSLSISGGNSVNLSTLNTDGQNLTLSGSTLSISGGNSVTLPSEVDGSITNEIQDMSLSGNTLSLSGDATTVSLAAYLDNTDSQNLNLTGSTLSISGGNSVNLSAFAGTDTDDQTLTLSGTNLSIADGNTVNLSSINTDNQALSIIGNVISLTNGGSVTLPAVVDGSVTNEIQDLSLSGTTLVLSSDATTVNLAAFLDNTDSQALSISGNTLSISGGNAISLPAEVDGSTTNEIQDLSLTGNILSLSGDASTVSLASYLDNTDSQSLTLTGTSLTISGGNTINLSTIDTDDQTLSLTGSSLSIAGGNSVTLPSEVDGSITNEIQDMSLSGNTLSLSGDATTVSLASYLDNTDSQSLSLSGSTLSISGGNSVALSSLDTDDQTLTLSGTTLSIDGGNSVTLPAETDGSVSNELQTLSLSGSSLSISSGNSIDLSSLGGSDDQNLGEVLSQGTDAGNRNIVNVAQAGIGTSSPNASAALEISSTTRGFLPPRMTQAQRDLITPVEGLIVYNTSTHKPNYYNGTEWMNYDGTTAKTLVAGVAHEGGIIAYIYIPGDAGYVAGETHGIITTPADQSASASWGCAGTIMGTTSGLGQGDDNTANIVSGCATAGIAARICNDLVYGGYSDWVLPSKDELYRLYGNRIAIGGFVSTYYWSSTESTSTNSFYYSFANGVSYNTNKANLNAVRAIRYF